MRLSKRATRELTLSLGLLGLAGWLMMSKLLGTQQVAAAMPPVTVTSTADDGSVGTLRQVIAAAASGDTINFSVTGTIMLTMGELLIDKSLSIAGPGAATLTISGNNASRVFEIAGGVTAMISDLTISNGNVGGDAGGGVRSQGTLTIINSTISGNSASNGGDGGGIYNAGGSLLITDSTLSNNSAFGGGGIYVDTGTVTVTNSTLSNNSGFGGGGIYCNRGSVTVTNSTLSNNSAFAGGGIYGNTGTVTVTNSTLSGNSAGAGGGVYHGSGTMTITNGTLSGNTANGGGGVYHSTGTLNIANCTISSNIALGGGGGGIFNGQVGALNIKNSIVANSTGPDCLNSPPGTLNATGKNFTTDGTCPGFTQVTPAQLNLGPLQVNPPGTTATHALLAGSVAIDAVTDCTDVAMNPVTTDQRGIARPIDGDGDGTIRCDVGAYEAPPCTNGEPPQITCPSNVTAVAVTCPPSSNGIVTFPPPTASDNCPGVTTNCTPPSGSSFPVGTTTVTCTATDAAAKTAMCSFTVTVFNGCLQDDSESGTVVLFNTTGQYRFCCNGTVFTGTGTATVRGCILSLQQNGPDRRVQIIVDLAVRRGTASLQSPFGSMRCTITDRDMTNNTCACQ
jgi:hypothetical protein